MKEFGGFLLCGSNQKWADKLKGKIQKQLQQKRKDGSFKGGKITFGFWHEKKRPYVQICTGGKEEVLKPLLFLLESTVREEKMTLFINNDATGGRTKKLTPKRLSGMRQKKKRRKRKKKSSVNKELLRISGATRATHWSQKPIY